MTDNPLTGKVGLDVTDFKAGIAALNREIRVVESGFRATAAGLDNWAKSATGLEARIKALNSEIDLQRQKVMALESEYKRVAAEKGANSRAAQELEIKLNKENETLNKLQLELGQTETALAGMEQEERDAAAGADQLEKEENQAVSATDRLKGALGRLTGTLKSVGADFKALGTKVLKGVAIGLAGIGVAAAGAAVGIARMLGNIIPAASDLEETMNKVNVVLGDSAKAVIEFSKTAANKLGQSQQEALNAAASFAVFGKAAGLTGKDLSDFSIDLTGLASDMASFSNTTPQEAIDALGSALRGEAEPIRAFGVLLNDATLKEKALEMGLISTTKEALTPQQKVLAAYNVILEQTTDAQGDFARTSTGLANAQRIQAARWKDLKVSIGTAFLPIAEKVFVIIGDISEALTKWLASPEIQAGLKKFTDGIAKFGAKFGWLIKVLLESGPASIEFREALANFIPRDLIEKVVSLAGAFSDFINNTLLPFVREHAEEIKGALIGIGAALAAAGIVAAILGIVGAIAALANPVGLIIALAGLLGAAWAGNWGGIREKTQEVIDFLKPYIEAFIAGIKAWWDENGAAIIAAVQLAWNTIKTTITTVINVIKVVVSTVLGAIKKFWDDHGEAIKAAAQAAWDFIKERVRLALDIIKNIFSAFKKAFQGDWEGFGQDLRKAWDLIWEDIKKTLSKAWEWIKKTLKELANKMLAFFTETDWAKVGEDIILGIIAGLEKAGNWLRNALLKIAAAALKAFKGFFGIKSPSELMADEIGRPMAQGIADGFREGMRSAIKGFKLPDYMSEIASSMTIPEITPTGQLAGSRIGRMSTDNRRTIYIYGGLHLSGVENAESMLEELARLMP